jgi:spore germination protein KA
VINLFFKSKKKYKEDESTSFDERLDRNDLDLLTDNIKGLLEKNSDVKFRDIFINDNKKLKFTLIFVDGLINSDYISNYILKPIIQEKVFNEAVNVKEVIKQIDSGKLYFVSQQKVTELNKAMSALLYGATLLVFDSEKTAIVIDAKGFEKRSISEPTGESVLKGSKDSFVELLRINTATIRRNIKSHNLVIEETVVGKQSRTPVATVYMNNITNRNIIDEVKKRLNAIEVDRAITAGFIEEFIVDDVNSPFPQVIYTERPDKFCSNIVDGKVGLIIDGLPIAYVIPATFIELLQAPEDYSQHFLISSSIRFLRYVALFFTLIIPSLYIAITSFHQEMIPSELATSIASAKEGVPFPMFVEVILMLAAFEVLVEAGLRLPKSIGQAVSIVGALVVGQSAVEAKLLSPATVVVIAITAITSFTMPNQDLSNALRLWRFVLVIFSSLMGIFGLCTGLLILLFHLCQMESFGVPYLSPIVASKDNQYQDTFFRLPLKFQKERPLALGPINKRRMK